MLFYLFCMFDDYGRKITGALNLVEKASSRLHIYEDPFLTKIIVKFLLSQMTGGAKRGNQLVHVGPTPPGGADGPPGTRAGGVVALAHRGQPPFAYFYPL